MTNECEGSIEKIPKMDPFRLSTGFWTTVGRVISHAFVMYGMFPIELCLASVSAVVTGQVTNKVLMASFLNCLSEGDRAAVLKGMDSTLFPSVKDRLIHVLSMCGGLERPTPSNLEKEILAVASLKLVWQPIYPLLQFKKGLECHGIMWLQWSEDNFQELYVTLSPDGQKVCKKEINEIL